MDFPTALGALVDPPKPASLAESLADQLTVMRIGDAAGADLDMLWSSQLSLQPAEFAQAMTADLPLGARVIVTFFGDDGLIVILKSAEGRRLMDGDLTTAGGRVFLRRLGRDGVLGRDATSRIVLRNLVRVARRQGISGIETYPAPGDAGAWISAGFRPTASVWSGALAPALLRRVEVLKRLTRERAELNLLQEVAGQIDAADLESLARLTSESRPLRGLPLGEVLLAPDLKEALQIPAPLQRDPGLLLPRWIAALPLRSEPALARLKSFLAG